MILVNFAHPLTAEQVQFVSQLVGYESVRFISALASFDEQQPFAAQTSEMIDGLPVTSDEWQNEPIAIVLPSLNFIAAVLVAELHGRMGYFPTIVRIRPVAGATPRRYEVAELIDLQAVRDAARTTRGRGTRPDQGG